MCIQCEMKNDDLIVGEEIQLRCDIYLGLPESFVSNPKTIQPNKYKDFNQWTEPYDNPRTLFCYSDYYPLFAEKIKRGLVLNDFILYTHNSDGIIEDTPDSRTILESSKCIEWHAQNKCMDHPKLKFMPIGIANSRWPHGADTFRKANPRPKTKNIYFQFTIDTNRRKRAVCYQNLKDHLEWLPLVDPLEHFIRLSEYKYCICPEGNGPDTHRLWECFYLNVIPIVKASPFTNQLIQLGIPLIVCNDWDMDEIYRLTHLQ